MRRKYIIDPKFQWTIIVYTVGVSVVTTLWHVIVGKLEDYEQLQIAAGAAGGYLGPRAVIAALSLGWFAGIFIISVLLSNRLAGPLYRLRRHMDEVSSGKEGKPLSFRKDDYFTELKDAYNRLLAFVQSKKRDGGFTIAELMVAMAIGLTVTLMAVNFYINNSQASVVFNRDVTNLQKVLLAARNASVTKNQCSLVTRVNPTTLSIATYPMTLPCSTIPLPAPSFEMSQTFSPESVLSEFSTGTVVKFAPGGGVVSASPITITLSSAHGKSNQFTIYPAIGQVRHQ